MLTHTQHKPGFGEFVTKLALQTHIKKDLKNPYNFHGKNNDIKFFDVSLEYEYFSKFQDVN